MKVKLLAIFTCILWGSAFAGAKIGFEYMPPILLSGMRFMLAGALLIPFILYKKVEIFTSIKNNWQFMTLFAFTQTFLQYGLFFIGLNRLPADIAAIIIGLGPLFVAIMAHITLQNDKITPRKIFSILLAISGVVFISISKGNNSQDSTGFYIGVLLLLFSNLLGGYANIMVAKYKQPLSPILLTSFANFLGGVCLFIAGVFIETFPSEKLPIGFYGSLIWLATISSVSFSIWYTILKRPNIKVSDLNMWKFIIPITGCVLSWLIVPGESPNKASIIGIIIITIALQIYQQPKLFSFGRNYISSKRGKS